MKLIDLVCAYYGRMSVVDRKGEEIYKNAISNREFYELTRDFAKEADVEIFALVIDDKGFAELKVWLIQSEEEVVKKMIQTRKEEESKWKKNQKKMN